VTLSAKPERPASMPAVTTSADFSQRYSNN
jgi:hypothetical protein